MEGRAVSIARHWLVGLAFLAVAATGTETLAQRRIDAASTPRRTAAPRAQSTGKVAARQVVHQPTLAVEDGPLGSFGPTDSDPPILMDAEMEMPSADSAILDSHTGCTTSCGSACQPCLGGWLQAEYLMWWPRPMQVPALVTSSAEASEGVLGAVGTETLVGGQMLDQMYSGGRLRLGLWADACQTYAWEAEGFFIGEVTDSSTFSGTGAAGSGVIARPFFNVLNSTALPSGGEDAELVAFPGQLSGSVTVEATSQLYGVGLHGLRTFGQSCSCRPALFSRGSMPTQSHFAGYAGWRYLRFAENLQINENLTSLLPSPDNGQFLIEDRFETGNSFNGADIGVVWQGCQGPYSLDLFMRLALGSNRQNVSIAGSTSLRGSGGVGNNFEDATGGLLAQRTNIGEYSRDRFAMVPELGITLGCNLSPQWRATIGYTFLYWSSVVRPGDQIDRDVNPNLFPPETEPFTGLERPVFAFVESDLWVNGLNLGLERKW